MNKDQVFLIEKKNTLYLKHLSSQILTSFRYSRTRSQYCVCLTRSCHSTKMEKNTKREFERQNLSTCF